MPDIISGMYDKINQLVTLVASIAGIVSCYFSYHQWRGTQVVPASGAPVSGKAERWSNLWLILLGTAIVSFAAAGTFYVIGMDKPYVNTNKKEIVQKKLDSYYQSLRDGSFDANDYFASNVQTYISMTHTTPDAINGNVRRYYFPDWQERSISFTVDSITNRDGGYRVQVLEDGNYYRKSLKKRQHIKARALIDFDDSDKITQFQYTKNGLLIE